MREILDFFTLADTVPLLLLICLLRFVGGQMARERGALHLGARGCSAAGFLLYAGFGIDAWRPATASAFLTLGLRSLLAMGVTHGLALITLSVLRFFYHHLWAAPLARQRAWAAEYERRSAQREQEREEACRAQAECERRAEDERRQQEELIRNPPPPPPTREERLAAVKQRYEATLQLLDGAHLDETELRSARERAKQQYLRELDEVIR